ncbi:long-chain-fatty-acid--CoA ligase 4 isoform X3 [Leptinotarsa decemlineata]|uniref:long-chain-fatty-acid--CoA ligase 4 isoform X3 n=1 Tax=Leptinotarsa decemlineata TaxID=7539 RepID=UPI003D3040D1
MNNGQPANKEKPTDGCGLKFLSSLLQVTALLCDIVTFPIYLIIQNSWKVRQLAAMDKAVPIEQSPGSITIKSTKKPTPHHVEFVRHKIDTMVKLLEYASNKHGDKKCLGTREILAEEDEVQPDGKVFKKFKMGEYKWKSYIEVNTMALHFGNGLRELGNEPLKNIAILAETRTEWMIAAHGVFKQNIPLVTVYVTLGDEAVAHALNETEVTTVITSFSLLSRFENILKLAPKIDTVIYMEDQLKTLTGSRITDGYKDRIRIKSFSDVIELGEKSNIVSQPPTPKDTAIIMYTSGSTGVPKGVILLHKNMTNSVKGFLDSTKMYVDTEVVLGYLPLAHVFELLVESGVIFYGIPIGYSSALTMLDSSSKIMKGCAGDVTVLKPTFMNSVPLIMDRIAKSIQDKVSKSSDIKRVLFNFGCAYKMKWTQLGYSTPLTDRIIFGAVKKIMGGRLRLIAAGGAPLTAGTQQLVKTCLCTDIITGYGLTETCSCACNTETYDLTFGRVGAPMTLAYIQLVDWEEGQYFVSDKPYPRGEIIVGGENVSPGYYQRKSNDFFEKNGVMWFRTGDIGEIHKDGCLKIIDRKKDLVKLQAGEYVSLGKVESQLVTCSLIENICALGDSTKNAIAALIVPHEEHLLELGKKVGVQGKSLRELCADSGITKAVLAEIQTHAKKVNLAKFEVPAVVKLVTDQWVPESGLVTASMKLKRRAIEEFYKKEITTMFAAL